jgi:hypothetical protein
MSGLVILDTWPRNKRESIRVQLCEFQGRPVIDIRTWFDPGTGELKPGRIGITLGVKHLAPLADALVAAYDHATRAGLVSEGDASDAPR